MAFFGSTMVRIHVSTSCFLAELCTQKKVQGGGVEGVSDALKKFQLILSESVLLASGRLQTENNHPRGKWSISLTLTTILRGTDEI